VTNLEFLSKLTDFTAELTALFLIVVENYNLSSSFLFTFNNNL